MVIIYTILQNAEKLISQYLSNENIVTSFKVNFLPKLSTAKSGDKEITLTKDIFRVYLEISAEKDSFIRVEAWLPKEWNGIFVGYGNGGMAGGIPIDSLSSAINQDFVGATTDMGTSRGLESGILNPAVHNDFGHRATHLMTVIAKKIIESAFGRLPVNSYFNGGSTGGQQALSEAERYPSDYDAILCGAPAHNRICLHTYFLWNFVHLKSKNKEPLFDFETCQKITTQANLFLKEKGRCYTENSLDILFENYNELICEFVNFVTDKLSLNKEQSSALQAVYSGPITKDNKQIHCGMPLGSELYSCGLYETAVSEDPPHDYPFYWCFGKNFNAYKFDFDKDLDTILNTLSPMDANNPNLAAFFKRGGKLMIVTGEKDSCVPFVDALQFALNVAKISEKEVLDENFRFYLIPTFHHGIAGCYSCDVTTEEGEDLLTMLINWHSKGYNKKTIKANLLAENDTEREQIIVYPIELNDEAYKRCPPTTDINLIKY